MSNNRKDIIKGSIRDMLGDIYIEEVKEKAEAVATYYNILVKNGMDESNAMILTTYEFYGYILFGDDNDLFDD